MIDSAYIRGMIMKVDLNCMSRHQPIEHVNPVLIVVLTVITFGLYSLYLLYLWIIALNNFNLTDKKMMTPGWAVILTMITFGIAGIYFQYEVAHQTQAIAKGELPKGFSRSMSLRPPRKHLKEIVLFGSIASFALFIASSGILSVVAFIFDIWLILEIQAAMEYCFGATPNDV